MEKYQLSKCYFWLYLFWFYTLKFFNLLLWIHYNQFWNM
jgi:hypothetical protein